MNWNEPTLPLEQVANEEPRWKPKREDIVRKQFLLLPECWEFINNYEAQRNTPSRKLNEIILDYMEMNK
jgi:hypothetical protein